MASAFTSNEKETIRRLLMEAARHCAATIGMRKTTIDHLTSFAGISKSAFYKFYFSKEALFLEVLEEWHERVYGSACRVLREETGLPIRERTEKALLTACRVMEQDDMMRFSAQELPYILRRLPKELLDKHYHSDEKHIEDLIDLTGAAFTLPRETVKGVARLLLSSLLTRSQIGPHYQPALEALIHCACQAMIVVNPGRA